jgi:hypothetical protein
LEKDRLVSSGKCTKQRQSLSHKNRVTETLRHNPREDEEGDREEEVTEEERSDTLGLTTLRIYIF